VALRGVVEAAEAGIIKPTLVGSKDKLLALARKIGLEISAYPMTLRAVAVLQHYANNRLED
jgi:hypothetical protein